jgi:NhaP-type Na+/H+ or K+/H+ antiporter
MIVLPVNAEKSIAEAIQAILSVTEAVSVSPLTMDEQFTRAT